MTEEPVSYSALLISLYETSDEALFETVKEHLAKGEDPNLASSYGETPLGQAFFRGRMDVFSLLLDHGADLSGTHWGSLHKAVALGNWMFAATTSDQYWGPGWQSSMLLSNNARPIPSLAFGRNLTTPFRSRWLSWLGSWDLSVLAGFLEDDGPDRMRFRHAMLRDAAYGGLSFRRREELHGPPELRPDALGHEQ